MQKMRPCKHKWKADPSYCSEMVTYEHEGGYTEEYYKPCSSPRTCKKYEPVKTPIELAAERYKNEEKPE